MESEIKQPTVGADVKVQDTTLQRAFRELRSILDNPSKIGTEAHTLGYASDKLDGAEISIGQESRTIGSRVDNTDSFVRQLYQTMVSKLDNREKFLRQQFLKNREDMGSIDILIQNSTISHLGQKVHPLPAYNVATQNSLPIPEEFPPTALALYNLQYSRNWRKLKKLLVYYELEAELIQLTEFVDRMAANSDLDSDVDSESESKSKPRKRDFDSAVESNPSGGVSILARHLGVDYNVLRDRIEELEFLQEMKKGRKRRSDDSPRTGGRSKRILLPLLRFGDERHADKTEEPESRVTSPASDGASSEGNDTTINWKNDSVNVLQHYQDMGYGSTSLKDEDVQEERTSVSENRSSRNGPCSPTREVTSPEIQQNLG